MSNSIFIIALLLLGGALYFYLNYKWKKREQKVNDFAYEMQRDFAASTQTLNKGVDYYKSVQDFYEDRGYTLSKHPDFTTDFIAKKEKSILFIRIQAPHDKQSITAKLFQVFVGQTVLYALDNPLYAAYDLSWTYVCSRMMCDRTARIYMKRYENRLKFELIEVE